MAWLKYLAVLAIAFQGILAEFESDWRENDSFVDSAKIWFLNEIFNYKPEKKSPTVYWNVPTFQCDWHKLNFSKLAEKYKIRQNTNDRFRGDEIAILYDPGSFPAILKDGTKTILRNGGVPQEGNLTYHIELFTELLDQLIPNSNFSGLAVIDFESWRPVFRQNFGTLEPYKTLSTDIVKKKHPNWSRGQIEKLAAEHFEYYAKIFMNETIEVARELRPFAKWGYYHYPYCFNMSPKNNKKDCPREVQIENDRISWLFGASDTLHPSLYLSERLTLNEKLQMIEGRISEANRIAKKMNFGGVDIIPYYWYKYLDNHDKFVAKGELLKTLSEIASSDVNGVIIWGSSNDVNTKSKCLDLYNFVDNILGPIVLNVFK